MRALLVVWAAANVAVVGLGLLRARSRRWDERDSTDDGR